MEASLHSSESCVLDLRQLDSVSFPPYPALAHSEVNYRDARLTIKRVLLQFRGATAASNFPRQLSTLDIN